MIAEILLRGCLVCSTMIVVTQPGGGYESDLTIETTRIEGTGEASTLSRNLETLFTQASISQQLAREDLARQKRNQVLQNLSYQPEPRQSSKASAASLFHNTQIRDNKQAIDSSTSTARPAPAQQRTLIWVVSTLLLGGAVASTWVLKKANNHADTFLY